MRHVILIASAWLVCAALAAPGSLGQDSSSEAATVTARATSTAPAAVEEAPAKPAEKTDEMAVSFKGMTMEQVAAFLGKELNKPVVFANEELKKKKIDAVSEKKLPTAEALRLIRRAMLLGGVVLDHRETVLIIRSVEDVARMHLPHVPADQSVETIDDVMAIVRKDFVLEHCSPGKLAALIQPRLPSFGRIAIDPDLRMLTVTDTVEDLLQIEQLIVAADVPAAAGSGLEIIEVKHADAADLVGLLRHLIAGQLRVEPDQIEIITSGALTADAPKRGGRNGPPGRRPGRPSRPSSPAKAAAGPAVTEITGAAKRVTLVADVSRNWIIATAPPEVMAHIKRWVKQYDKAPAADAEAEPTKPYDLIPVRYADVGDMARQLSELVAAMPGADVRGATRIVPFGDSKQLMVYGSKAMRERVVDLLEELDVENANKRASKTFELKYADAEEMAELVEQLYSGRRLRYQSTSNIYQYRSWAFDKPVAEVQVIPNKRRNTITVITDPMTLEKVEEIIAEYDTKIDTTSVMPKRYTIQHVDPGELQTLLAEMFSERQPQRRSFWDMIYGRGQKAQVKPIGRLLGQFTFRVLPSSNVLLVQAKNPVYFAVIDELIDQLDQPTTAGVPEIVELNHANAEDLCEQLNAILARGGTRATIRRASRGLTDYSPGGTGEDSGNNRNSGDRDQVGPGEMGFPWQTSGARQREGEVPTSNLIGKVRIVPMYQRNALLVLAPEGYREPIRKLIQSLDQYSRQVIINAQIGEIVHDDQTTLGLRIASDPTILSAADTAIRGAGSGLYNQAIPIFGGTVTLDASANVSALLNLLIKEYDMKILQTPTITTSDNKASESFDGQIVSIRKGETISEEGGRTSFDIEEKEVGTTLRIRPHITNDGSVDLLINLEISRVVPGSESQGNFIFDIRRVTTHVIVKHGQTIMLSGVLRQDDFRELRKVPLLGDIPLLGELFRSIDDRVRNRELVIFVTPRVMQAPEDVDREMKPHLKTLEGIRNRDLDADDDDDDVYHDTDNDTEEPS